MHIGARKEGRYRLHEERTVVIGRAPTRIPALDSGPSTTQKILKLHDEKEETKVSSVTLVIVAKLVTESDERPSKKDLVHILIRESLILYKNISQFGWRLVP
jgi:hypothetical protein